MRVNAGTLVASSALVACDWNQTRHAAARGWHIGELPQWEANPLLGRAPSTGAVDAYFAGTIAVNAAVWYFVPARWRSVLPGFVIGAESATVLDNAQSRDNPEIVEALMRRDGIERADAATKARRLHTLCGM